MTHNKKRIRVAKTTKKKLQKRKVNNKKKKLSQQTNLSAVGRQILAGIVE